MERTIKVRGDEHDFRNDMQIYRNSRDDSSNGGISAHLDEVILVDRDWALANPDKLNDNDIVVVIRDCSVNSKFDGYLTAYPAKGYVSNKLQMFGGTFVYTCNSATNPFAGFAIPLHDRIEGE